MKRTIILAVIVVISITFMTLAAAQDRSTPTKESKTTMMNKEMNKEWNKETSMSGAHNACGMMMGSYLQHCMVASNDGGVIVMVGDKLQKFDRDLKLVKEITVAIDMEHMENMMSRMTAMCNRNMMPGENMMRGGTMPGGAMQKDGMDGK